MITKCDPSEANAEWSNSLPAKNTSVLDTGRAVAKVIWVSCSGCGSISDWARDTILSIKGIYNRLVLICFMKSGLKLSPLI